jgi:tRNA(Ser,Leu) C12 N-acetylase TAN1
MFLKDIIYKSYYTANGYIESFSNLDTLEQYINFNLPVLSKFKNVVIATTYKTQVGEIVRDMTEDEIAEYQLVLDDIAAKNEAEVKAQVAKEAAQAKLAALGITAEDLEALGF